MIVSSINLNTYEGRTAMDPDFDFITNILNVSSTDVEKLNFRTDADTTFYEVTLVRKPMICPYCRGSMIGYGHKKRTIKTFCF